MSGKRARYSIVTEIATPAGDAVRDDWDHVFTGLDAWELAHRPAAPLTDELSHIELFARETHSFEQERSAALMLDDADAELTPFPPTAASLRLASLDGLLKRQLARPPPPSAPVPVVSAPAARPVAAAVEDLDDSDEGAPGACPLCGKPLNAFAKGAKAHVAQCAAALMDNDDWQ